MLLLQPPVNCKNPRNIIQKRGESSSCPDIEPEILGDLTDLNESIRHTSVYYNST